MPLCDQLEHMMRSLSTLQQSLQIALNQLAQGPDQDQSLNATDQAAAKPIWQQSTELLPQFLEILQALEQADIAPATEQQILPYQTEAHRRLRLIKTEAMRLRTARQKATLDKSHAQLSGHVTALQQFAEAIARALCKTDNSSAQP